MLTRQTDKQTDRYIDTKGRQTNRWTDRHAIVAFKLKHTEMLNYSTSTICVYTSFLLLCMYKTLQLQLEAKVTRSILLINKNYIKLASRGMRKKKPQSQPSCNLISTLA